MWVLLFDSILGIEPNYQGVTKNLSFVIHKQFGITQASMQI